LSFKLEHVVVLCHVISLTFHFRNCIVANINDLI